MLFIGEGREGLSIFGESSLLTGDLGIQPTGESEE